MKNNNPEAAKCPYCFGTIDGRASVCRHCGRRVKGGGKAYLGRLIIAAGVLSLAGVFFVDPVLCLGTAVVLILLGAFVGGRE